MGAGNNSKSPTTKNANNHQQYIDSFKIVHNNQQALSKILHQSPRFGANLGKMFPYHNSSYIKYTEMIQFLRRYDPVIQDSPEVKEIAKSTSLLDRFFMICLGVFDVKKYQQIVLSIEEADQLLSDYMALFTPEPKNKHIQKILQYLRIKEQKIKPKQFGEKMRQYFSQTEEFLKLYYRDKFKHVQKYAFLLKDIKSQILQEDAVFLSLRVPRMVSGFTTLLYSSQKHGIGFHSIENKILGYTGPWLLLIQHSQKNQNGSRIKYVFGSYQNGPIKDTNAKQGDLTGFLFTIEPKVKFMTTDKGQGGNNYFFINNINPDVSKKRMGIGFGGDAFKQNCKLWIDQDIYKSTVFNGNDKTYGFGTLASHATDVLSIRKMEIWALGNEQNLKQQAQYWQARQDQIEKRRKVNKKELIDGNAGLLMGKTFGHRDQVVGDMDWDKKQMK